MSHPEYACYTRGTTPPELGAINWKTIAKTDILELPRLSETKQDERIVCLLPGTTFEGDTTIQDEKLQVFAHPHKEELLLIQRFDFIEGNARITQIYPQSYRRLHKDAVLGFSTSHAGKLFHFYFVRSRGEKQTIHQTHKNSYKQKKEA